MIFLKPFLLVYTDFIYLIFLFLCYTTENIWFKTVIISLVLFHNFFSHLKVISKNPKYLPLINAQGFWKANEGDFTNGLTFLVENTVYLAEYHTRTRDVGFLGPSKCGGLEERTCMSYFVESTLIPSQTHENLRYDQIIILLNANCLQLYYYSINNDQPSFYVWINSYVHVYIMNFISNKSQRKWNQLKKQIILFQINAFEK